MLTYCKHCVMPDTKPYLHLDREGVCDACRSYDKRKVADWKARHEELVQLLENYRRPDGSNWDCIVPVSGGKDSTHQVVRLLQLVPNPLCVTSTTSDLSALGRKNIENLKHLGVDYVEMIPNPLIRAKLNRIGLTQVGDISWPEHVGVFTIPMRVAVQFNVPFIIWDENSQNEDRGAGEILLTYIERDGTVHGYDLALNEAVASTVEIPLIASISAGIYQHMVDVVKQAGASAFAAANMFYFTENTPAGAKAALAAADVTVRKSFVGGLESR